MEYPHHFNKLNKCLQFLPICLYKICESYLDSSECIYYCNNWNQFPKNEVCNIAAKYGWLDLIKWARESFENDNIWDRYTCVYAAYNGHLEVLKYLHTNGCKWNVWTCDHAALNGHLEVLIYAHKNGCTWDNWTCNNAAINGHLEVLKYAHENGCTWDYLVCYYAARNNNKEISKYVCENGCVCGGIYH